MPLVIWDNSYSVGVQDCDSEHQRIFALLNSLHEAALEGQGCDVMAPILQELADYVRIHFSAEEALLEKTKYGDLAPQKRAHKTFETKVAEFRQSLALGTVSPIAGVELLKNWLATHIKQMDRQYAKHLKTRGIQ